MGYSYYLIYTQKVSMALFSYICKKLEEKLFNQMLLRF